jgi:response regulator RpfG family c-di-GMP phosphodiesterase
VDINAVIDAINKGGAYQYITKPWNNNDLVLSVRAAIERYRLVVENRYLTELTNRQNEELKQWSAELETYVQQQTIDLTYANKELLETNEKLRRNFRDFTITIANLIELRDKTVANHSNEVAAISKEIAKRLGLSAEEIGNVAVAGQLHDIGKIGISDEILLKGIEALAPYEMHEYMKHPIRGQAAMDSNEALREPARFIRSHHESWNGNGFPDGLKGNEIPLGSRIIAIADRYDRLLMTRTMQAALEEIHALTAVQFDPGLYHPLVEVVKERTAGHLMNRKVEKMLGPQGLIAGMVLSREVRSGTGVLLLSKGVTLTPQRIESIRRHFNIDPPDSGGVYVWVDG